ncbi:NAD-dependent epimerase/dehydratase family protein [Candidatus Pacearchaeota archaeon]|nr:NAD-dependent epimerase/dehydratase family protein [Candidatus Pacearchaeota archaeon]
MRVMVTGSRGFIGKHVVKELANHEVFEYDISIPGRDQDVCSKYQCSQFLAANKIEAVIHLAAHVSVGDSVDNPHKYVYNNSYGTSALMKAIQDFGKVRRLVVASSMAIYGDGPSYRPVLESDDLSPCSPYGISKLSTEKIAQLCGELHDIPTCSLRLWDIYGEGQDLFNSMTGVVPIFTNKILSREPIVIHDDGEQIRDFIHVSDVARAFRLALESDFVGAVNVCTQVPTSIRRIATLLYSKLGYDSDMPVMDVTGVRRLGDARHGYGCADLAQKVLNFRSRLSLSDGLDGWVRFVRSSLVRVHSGELNG